MRGSIRPIIHIWRIQQPNTPTDSFFIFDPEILLQQFLKINILVVDCFRYKIPPEMDKNPWNCKIIGNETVKEAIDWHAKLRIFLDMRY